MPGIGSLVMLASYEPNGISRAGLRGLQHLFNMFRRIKDLCLDLLALHPGYISRVQQVYVILHQFNKRTITARAIQGFQSCADMQIYGEGRMFCCKGHKK